ncbi:MAG: ribonuclease J [Microcystaceae cyanobacterium]
MTQTNAQSTLKITPLGGLHEIGKNTCVFEYEDEIMLLDAGIGFPSDDMHGINVVLPDMTYLRENHHKIKGMIVTHGHEDHIGGIAYHLKQFEIPIIHGPRLAMALLGDKLEEAGLLARTKINTVLPRDMVRVGKNFLVEFIRNTHSICDSFCVAIHTPLGVVIHSGDFKFDFTPMDGETFDVQRLAEHGEKGVLCLLSDSTNAEVSGHTPSESSVMPNMERVFQQTKGRLMVTTFASSVHRLNIVLQLAQKYGRKVAVVGRSMLNVIAHCRNLGYLKCPDNLFVPLKALKNLPDEQTVILTTGSQGEPLAAMTRISNGEHPHIKVRQGDTIVFSANPIPGNTIAVVNTIDRLMMQGANVVYGRSQGIHVSGHGAQEDHKLMLALTKPKFFMPVHGEHRMLIKHAQTGQNMGVPAENIVIVDNGDQVGLTLDSISIIDQVPSGIELVDQAGIVHEHVMEERQQLAQDGVIVVSGVVDHAGKLQGKPDINLRGVVTNVERSLLNQLIIRAIERGLEDEWSNFSDFSNEYPKVNWKGLQSELEMSVQRLVRRELRSNSLVIVLLQMPKALATATNSTNSNGNGANGSPTSSTKSVEGKTTPVRTYRRKRSTASAVS